MILKAKHNIILDPFFRWFVIRKMKKSFNSVHFMGELKDRKKAVLLICNHISWWDGIWALHFNQQILLRKYHFMMLEDQLRKNWFFNYTGGFSIKKNSRSIIESMEYTAELLANKNNLVLVFPQGVIQSMHKPDFIFEKGIEKIIQKTKAEIQIIFLANVVDYLSSSRPNLYLFYKEYSGEENILEMQNNYNLFYKKCIDSQKKLKV